MKSFFSLGVSFLVLLVSSIRGEPAATVKFSDPAKPGLLKIYFAQGDLKVRGSSTAAEISVNSTAKAESQPVRRADGLRVLSDTGASFQLTEKDNVAEFNSGKEDWPMGDTASFEIIVPAATALEVQNGWGGTVAIEKVTGDVEVKGLNCEVKLVELGGGAVVETMNGAIDATFGALPEKKPISFSSMNGEVKLRVPANAKANVRFRSHNGAILTDFPEDALKTKTENLGRTDWGKYAGQHVAIASQVAGEVAREVAKVAHQVATEVQTAVREAQRAESESRKAEAEVQRVEAETAAAEMAAKATGTAPSKVKTARPIRSPRPPRPPSIPAIAGGKVVSGTLNGGGIDLQVTTMNGDITLRRQP
ncbi:MAG: hypothetical protein HZA31_11735 [Opitutae bacterium]|nr:hypothetical protein [Opitutae bacterium]